jgi:hypothetical protein
LESALYNGRNDKKIILSFRGIGEDFGGIARFFRNVSARRLRMLQGGIQGLYAVGIHVVQNVHVPEYIVKLRGQTGESAIRLCSVHGGIQPAQGGRGQDLFFGNQHGISLF